MQEGGPNRGKKGMTAAQQLPLDGWGLLALGRSAWCYYCAKRSRAVGFKKANPLTHLHMVFASHLHVIHLMSDAHNFPASASAPPHQAPCSPPFLSTPLHQPCGFLACSLFSNRVEGHRPWSRMNLPSHLASSTDLFSFLCFFFSSSFLSFFIFIFECTRD